MSTKPKGSVKAAQKSLEDQIHKLHERVTEHTLRYLAFNRRMLRFMSACLKLAERAERACNGGNG